MRQPLKKDISFTLGVIQMVLIGTSLLMLSIAGPENMATGAFFGFGGMFVAFLAVLFAPVSLVVYLLSAIKHKTYKRPDARTIAGLVFQLINIGFLVSCLMIVLQLQA